MIWKFEFLFKLIMSFIFLLYLLINADQKGDIYNEAC